MITKMGKENIINLFGRSINEDTALAESQIGKITFNNNVEYEVHLLVPSSGKKLQFEAEKANAYKYSITCSGTDLNFVLRTITRFLSTAMPQSRIIPLDKMLILRRIQ